MHKKAYLYFGGPGTIFNRSADVIIQNAADDSFGISIDSAGDLNADGFSDLAIGEQNNSARGIGAGRAYIYLGGVDGTLDLPDVILSGTFQYQSFANYVSSGGGDINGDGYSDIVISSHSFDDDIHMPCQADVYFGAKDSPLEEAKHLSLIAEAPGYCTSRSVIAGDLNDDGFSDILRGVQNAGANPDQLQFLLGKKTPDGITDFRIDRDGVQFSFLSAVTAVGDVNADGYDDVAAVDATTSPVTYIYLGRPTSQGAGVAVPAAGRLSSYSKAIRAAGDVNGDGFDDVIIGSSTDGRASIYFGAPGGSFDTTADWVLTNTPGFGESVTALTEQVH